MSSTIPNAFAKAMPPRGSRVRGIALVEYALTMPVLLVILAGSLNYGIALRTATAVSAAARAGAAYGSASVTNSTDTAGIQAAAVNSAPDVKSMTVTSARSCQCPGGSPVNCGGSCTGNVLMYVQVTVQSTPAAAFSYSGLGYTGTTTAQATMRVQ